MTIFVDNGIDDDYDTGLFDMLFCAKNYKEFCSQGGFPRLGYKKFVNNIIDSK